MPELSKIPKIPKITIAELISLDKKKDLQVYQVEEVESDGEDEGEGESESEGEGQDESESESEDEGVISGKETGRGTKKGRGK